MGSDARPGPAASLHVDVFSVFGEIVDAVLTASVIGRGRSSGLIDLQFHDPRDHASGAHKAVDDSPFGGGAGMVMSPEPLAASIRAADPARPLLALTAGGDRFDQSMAHELAAGGGFSLICGRYEGIDQRVIDKFVDREVSIGDYVLAGGEIAAAVIIEATGRLIPGVLGNSESVRDESFADGLIEYPHYTRPAEFEGAEVPAVLLSGDHGRVDRWRRAMSLQRTIARRPDMIERRGGLTDGDRALLAEFDL